MTKVQSVAALATLAVAFGFGGAAQAADPFADTPLSIQRVSPGTADNGTTTLWVFYDDGDNGTDATSSPNAVGFDRTYWSTLGIDQRGTLDTSDDIGGVVVLEFTDNVCLTDAGMDLDVYDAGDDESAMVEVSYDGGLTFHSLGEATPGAYELDADGVVPFFTQVRLTASDRSGARVGNTDLSGGIDVDAVECLNSIDAQGFAFDVDTCDMTSGDPGTDVDYVLVHSDGFTAYVELFFCGSVVDSSDYAVHFASPDTVTVASTETTTTDTTVTSTKSKKSKKKARKSKERKKAKKAKKAKKLKKARMAKAHSAPHPDQNAYDRANRHSRFLRDDDDDDDDDDDSSGGGACGMVPQHTVTYSNGVDSGGLVFVDDRRMSIEVTYAELSAFQADPMMLWVETADDNAPETDESDGCDSAEIVDEAVNFMLQ